MSPQAAELYREITGKEPPKPFDERTHEERTRARDEFIASVNEADMDDAVDELFLRARFAFTSSQDADAHAA